MVKRCDEFLHGKYRCALREGHRGIAHDSYVLTERWWTREIMVPELKKKELASETR